MAKLRVAVVTNLIPHYREDFYRSLFNSEELAVTVYAQVHIADMNLVTVDRKFPKRVRLVKAWTMSRERIGWQKLPALELWQNYDVLVFYGNPRVLSNVLYSLLYRCLGKPIVIWGQAHTSSAARTTEAIRLTFWRMFRYLFVYTDREADWLRSRGFSGHIVIGMNNGLNQRRIDAIRSQWSADHLAAWRQAQGFSTGAILLLSCARLEAKNRFDLVIDCLAELVLRHRELVWVVIGSGPEEVQLRTRASIAGIDTHVRWLGAIYEEEQLAPWFLSSYVFIHPGAVGLSLLHAFGYRLPVVTHDDETAHMPEFAAMENGVTGATFKRGDQNSLCSTLEKFLSDTEYAQSMGREGERRTRVEYNVDIMVERFHAVVKAASSGQKSTREI